MSDVTTDFVKATTRILAKIGTMLTHIERIEGDVKSIREHAINGSQKPLSDDQAYDSENEDSPSISSLNSNQPQRKKKQAKNESEDNFQTFRKRWWKQVKKPKMQISLATLAIITFYTCETKRTNDLTKASIDLTRSSVAAQVVLGNWDLSETIVAGNKITAIVPITNVGHMPATYAVEVLSLRGTQMPDGNFPLVTPEPNEIMQPNIPTKETIFDLQIASDEFIYGIPHLPRDFRGDVASRHAGPPFPRPTVFFYGILVYQSLGVRTEKQFCSYLAYLDPSLRGALEATTGDSRFIFMTCPRWNKTTEKRID